MQLHAAMEEQHVLSAPSLCCDLAFTPDSRRLAVNSRDGIKMWDVETGREVKRYDWKIGPVHSVAVSPDGLTAAAGGEKNQAVVWDLSED